ncbi:Fur family transcriptional regulator [Bombella favorum]|uniref:Ferric uptake regulation protein n=1 Tax=Bombella favorum TaxID=2039164 RepID=A0ABR5ZP55_9PROT|nr:Fur family transcriptional regulator [Bombella favorum]MBA5726044.1 transcriptional repressor [Bombella favorum]
MVMSTKKMGRDGAASGEAVGDSPIARLCVKHGLKMTGQRRVIARVLSEAEDHPDVEELYRRASELDSRISVATVYRTVRLLEEKGILERRDFGGGRARYEASENGHHYHLIDIDSGNVIEFENDELVGLLAKIAAELGFDLMSHRAELFGRRTASDRKKDTTSGKADDGSQSNPSGRA